MRRLLVALAALGLVMAALALSCGGGGGDKGGDGHTYAATVVPIRHIDFADAELTALSVMHPAQEYLDRYPDVVATVDGHPVTNESLVYREIVREMTRRQAEQFTLEDFGPFSSYFEDAASADPLETAIDDVLLNNAAERLGLMPSDQEAEEAATKYDTYLRTFLEDDATSQEDRERWQQLLRSTGQSEEGWWRQPKWIERFREARGATKLRNQYCDPVLTPTASGYLTFSTSGGNCDDFLAKERKNAKIVYYVRWAD